MKLDSEKIQDVELKTHDGEILHGWLLKANNPTETARRLVICFPGNSMNRLERLGDLQEIASFGYNVLVFDY